MDDTNLQNAYQLQKEAINQRILSFQNLPESEWLYELLFCLITPQSKGKKCWEAIKEIKTRNPNTLSYRELLSILSTKTRFHKTKARYIQSMLPKWPYLKEKIRTTPDPSILRDYLRSVKGLGMKEASHFLRNIGKSSNQLAILDRHILKNLVQQRIIKNPKNLDKKTYLSIEEKMKLFSKKINIPLDSIDLLLWSKETGEIFK